MYLKMLLAALVVSAAIPAASQVSPEATGTGVPLTVGVGYSNYYTDWSGRLEGPEVWADWNFYDRPSFLRGLGIEVEGRDLNYGRSTGQRNLRQDTVGGGPIYTWRRYDKFHPYAKFLLGYGSIDFNIGVPNYMHDTRTVYAPGGGAEVRVFRNVWVRGSYEYQFWTNFFNGHALNPQGLTIGASYDFRAIRWR
ncbi:MAG: outer membrane beta-barrel protein [Terracidiphilus sp.]